MGVAVQSCYPCPCLYFLVYGFFRWVCSLQCVNLSPSRLNLFPVYFLSDAIVNGIVFLISFLDCLIIKIQKYNWFLYIDFVSCKFLNLPLAKCLCDFLRIFFYTMLCNLSTETSFTSSLPVWMPFISFPILIDLTISSITELNRSSESGHLVWLPVLGEKLSVFIKCDVSFGFFFFFFFFCGCALSGWGNFLLFLVFVYFDLFLKDVGFSQNAFSAIIEKFMWYIYIYLSFISLMCIGLISCGELTAFLG